MLFAIVRALWRAVRRDLGTFGSLKVNNFFLFVALLVGGNLASGLAPRSAYPFVALLALVTLLPLSADPLDKIPLERLGLWPLGRGARLALRLGSMAVNPVVWIAIAILFKTARLDFVAAFMALAMAGGGVRVALQRLDVVGWFPLLPGRFGGIVSHHIRSMMTLLDTWLAALLCAVGILYRAGGAHPDSGAYPFFAILIALALSTSAQSLFGLDFNRGETLYRTLPLRGWEILVAKGAGFMTVLMLLTIAFSPMAGAASGLVSLALGHHSSVMRRIEHRRWRFTAGRLLPVGALQAFACVGAGVAAAQWGFAALAAAAALWLTSLWFYGRQFERR